MFHSLKRHIVERFRQWGSQPLFSVEIEREAIWQTYLAGFADPAIRQEHNCNHCKSFLRQFAGIVTIQDGAMVSLWDHLDVEHVYAEAIGNLAAYIHARPITDIFLHTSSACGTDKNFDRQRSITWEHFFLPLPPRLVQPNTETLRAAARDDQHVLKRSLDELTIAATAITLGLISENALYRGREHEGLLKTFLALQESYAITAQKENFCWIHSARGGAITRIRTTAIGTLLTDLSNDVALEDAVAKYERVVAPTNYKRPSAPVTPSMVEQARATLAHLELLDALNRRYATETDLHINDLIFVHKPSGMRDVFAEMSQEAVVNARAFAQADAMTIEDFLRHIVPTATVVDLLLEPKHVGNFVTLLTAQDPTAPLLFKWDNPFSWSYTGGITDAIKELVKDAGGNVQGELRVSLAWHNHDDLDLHVHEPNGNHIYFPNKRVRHASSGMLDVDMNAGYGDTRTPVENIIWTAKQQMPEGTYKITVHNFCHRETDQAGFTVQVECGGEVWEFAHAVNPKDRAYQPIVDCVYSRTDGLRIPEQAQPRTTHYQKWGLRTAQWHTVTRMLLSPNYWGTNANGNKHYLFALAGCISDEAPRPFYNEFLKQELEVHRKVFEILGSKIAIASTPDQVSGVGFSETQRAQVIMRVTSRSQRVIKVNF
mgnify:CR=1 FL=1